MRELFLPLLHLQRFIVPAILVGLVWAIWRTVFKKDFAIGLALYVSLVVVVDAFYNTGLYIPGLQQGSIKYSEICALVLLFQRPDPALPSGAHRTAIGLVGAYFALLLFAALRAHPLMVGIFDFRKVVFPQIAAFTLAARGFPRFTEYRRFLLAVGVLALIVAAFSFWDVIFDRNLLHSDMLGKPEYYINRKHQRFGSVFLNPNFLGAFVVLLFPTLFMIALHDTRRWVRLYIGVVLLALVFSLVQTQSRAPMLGFAASLALLALGPAGKISRTRRVVGLAVGLLALVVLMPGFFTRATDRFDTLHAEESTDEVSRASVWLYTEGLIAQHPLLGVGLGEEQFLAAMAKTDFRERFGRQSLDNPHNSYLEIAVFAGVPALVIFAVANLVLLIKAGVVSLRRSLPAPETGLAFGLTAGIFGFLLSVYPDMQLFTSNVGPVYWLLFALLLSLILRIERGGAGEVATAPGGNAVPRRAAASRKGRGAGGAIPLPTGTRH